MKHIALIFIFVLNIQSSHAQRLKASQLNFDESVNILHARLLIEQEILPSIQIEAVKEEMDGLELGIRAMPSFDKRAEDKLNALITYLYHPGDWNKHNPFQYDFTDPLGTQKPQNSLLSNYVTTRLGNCVSMPLLMLILGNRIGLDMALSLAPSHFFIQLRENGAVYNVEATAGGLKASGSYIDEFLITEKAVQNEIYMTALNHKETLAAMYYDLYDHYVRIRDFDEAQSVVNKVLSLNPNSVYGILAQGNVYWHQMDEKIKIARAEKKKITAEMREQLDNLLEYNLTWFHRAESLGWQEPPPDYDKRYLDMIERVKGLYENSN